MRVRLVQLARTQELVAKKIHKKRKEMSREALFEDVCSVDFLQFKFGMNTMLYFICSIILWFSWLYLYLSLFYFIGARGYQDQLFDSIAKTNVLSGKSCYINYSSSTMHIYSLIHFHIRCKSWISSIKCRSTCSLGYP